MVDDVFVIRSVARRGNDSRGSGTRAKRKMVEPLVVVLRGSFAAVSEEECRAHSFLSEAGGVGISLPSSR